MIPSCLSDRIVIDAATGCHLWQGATVPRGYGKRQIDGRLDYTHRISWIVNNGPIPDDLQVLHHCDQPRCCNIDHLFLGTQADNMRDMREKGRQAVGARLNNANARKTHCKRGHPFTIENTIVERDGHRRCRTCVLAASRARRRRAA